MASGPAESISTAIKAADISLPDKNAYRVTFDRGTAFIVGPKTDVRRRLAVCGDSSPIWVSRRGAWATSPEAANGLLDQLEGRKVAVPIEDTLQAELDLSEVGAANLAPHGGLW